VTNFGIFEAVVCCRFLEAVPVRAPNPQRLCIHGGKPGAAVSGSVSGVVVPHDRRQLEIDDAGDRFAPKCVRAGTSLSPRPYRFEIQHECQSSARMTFTSPTVRRGARRIRARTTLNWAACVGRVAGLTSFSTIRGRDAVARAVSPPPVAAPEAGTKTDTERARCRCPYPF